MQEQVSDPKPLNGSVAKIILESQCVHLFFLFSVNAHQFDIFCGDIKIPVSRNMLMYVNVTKNF